MSNNRIIKDENGFLSISILFILLIVCLIVVKTINISNLKVTIKASNLRDIKGEIELENKLNKIIYGQDRQKLYDLIYDSYGLSREITLSEGYEEKVSLDFKEIDNKAQLVIKILDNNLNMDLYAYSTLFDENFYKESSSDLEIIEKIREEIEQFNPGYKEKISKLIVKDRNILLKNEGKDLYINEYKADKEIIGIFKEIEKIEIGKVIETDENLEIEEGIKEDISYRGIFYSDSRIKLNQDLYISGIFILDGGIIDFNGYNIYLDGLYIGDGKYPDIIYTNNLVYIDKYGKYLPGFINIDIYNTKIY